MSVVFVSEVTNQIGVMPMVNNASCWQSYIKFICNSNFKMCDPQTNVSKPTCNKLCVDFRTECGLETAICNIEDTSNPALQANIDNPVTLNKVEFDQC